jgi:predicted O-methyltransferase YrrM
VLRIPAARVRPAERRWVAAIEQLRAELSASTATVRVTDFGARASDETLDRDQMARGTEEIRTVGPICRSASKPRVAALLLLRLIREFRPRSCLELGTSLGISALYQAAALELNRDGQLVTLEGAQTLAALANQHFLRLGLAHRIGLEVGRFADTLPRVLEAADGIDYAFIDGHHDGRATVEYFEQILPHVREPGILVFDDITWSPGMQQAWRVISAHERIDIAIPIRNMGIVTVSPHT